MSFKFKLLSLPKIVLQTNKVLLSRPVKLSLASATHAQQILRTARGL